MSRRILLPLALLSAVIAFRFGLSAAVPVEYGAELLLNAGSGDFAPYYIASNRHGILTQKTNGLVQLELTKNLSLSSRFSYGFGVEAVAGYSSKTGYLRYDQQSSSFQTIDRGPASVYLQQLYGEIKYRGIFLSAGMKERSSALLNAELSSGDLVESGNARPIPQVRAGFVDFQNIPFTGGWVQIQGEISYGKFADNDWNKDHYNYYNWHINLGGLYTYKRVYFRTMPSQPFSVTVGMQAAGMFGGTTSDYRDGQKTKETKCSQSLKTFFRMLLPARNEGSDFYDGNSLGSWDFFACYRFGDGTKLKAYVQKPWEDGSGIGWMNGFDGIWGLEYENPQPDAVVRGAVIEYLDFTNQSGPIHWSPDDSPGTTITSHATGGDQYYNNYQSNSYMNYGMSIGSPFLPSPLYNLDGYLAYVHNRVRGFHAGISGRIAGTVDYRLLGGYRKAWGDSRIPSAHSAEDTSMMIEAGYSIPSVNGLEVKAQVAFDSGSIYGDTFGACMTVSYRGLLNLGR